MEGEQLIKPASHRRGDFIQILHRGASLLVDSRALRHKWKLAEDNREPLMR
jgi:hypothetical protein